MEGFIFLPVCQVIPAPLELPGARWASGCWWGSPESTWPWWRRRTGTSGPWSHLCRAAGPARQSDQDPAGQKPLRLNESFTPVLIFKKICLCYSDLWIIEQVSGDMKHTDGVTHTGTRGSFGSGSAFDAQVTEWTALSSGTWEARRSHRTGTTGTTDCTFGSTLWNEWTTNRLLCSDCSCLSFIIFNHFHSFTICSFWFSAELYFITTGFKSVQRL